MRAAIAKLCVALSVLVTGYLVPTVASDAREPRLRTIGPSKVVKNVPRLRRPPRVPRIRRHAPAREPRALTESETERLRQTEEFIQRQSLPGSICRGC